MTKMAMKKCNRGRKDNFVILEKKLKWIEKEKGIHPNGQCEAEW